MTAPAVYARRPAGSVSDVADVPHLTAIRDLDGAFNVACDIIRLDWLDSDGKRYALVGLGTTVPGDGTLAGYSPGVIAPGWHPDCWRWDLMHKGTPYQQEAGCPTGKRLPWWPGHLSQIDRSQPPKTANVGLCFHEMWDTSSAPGVQVGNGSYGCFGVFPVGGGYSPFAAFRTTIKTLLARTGRTTFGVAVIEVRSGDALLGGP